MFLPLYECLYVIEEAYDVYASLWLFAEVKS